MRLAATLKEARIFNYGGGCGLLIVLIIDYLYYHVVTGDWRLLVLITGIILAAMIVNSYSGRLIGVRRHRDGESSKLGK